MTTKKEKIFLYVFVAILLICILFYNPLNRFTLVYLDAELAGVAPYTLGVAATIFILFDEQWAGSFKERLLPAFLCLIFGTGTLLALFELVVWVIEHVKIV